MTSTSAFLPASRRSRPRDPGNCDSARPRDRGAQPRSPRRSATSGLKDSSASTASPSPSEADLLHPDLQRGRGRLCRRADGHRICQRRDRPGARRSGADLRLLRWRRCRRDARGALGRRRVRHDRASDQVGGVTYARLETIPEAGDYREGDDELAWFVDAQMYARGLITHRSRLRRGARRPMA
jgi:hypothetical protein